MATSKSLDRYGDLEGDGCMKDTNHPSITLAVTLAVAQVPNGQEVAHGAKINLDTRKTPCWAGERETPLYLTVITQLSGAELHLEGTFTFKLGLRCCHFATLRSHRTGLIVCPAQEGGAGLWCAN